MTELPDATFISVYLGARGLAGDQYLGYTDNDGFSVLPVFFRAGGVIARPRKL